MINSLAALGPNPNQLNKELDQQLNLTVLLLDCPGQRWLSYIFRKTIYNIKISRIHLSV